MFLFLDYCNVVKHCGNSSNVNNVNPFHNDVVKYYYDNYDSQAQSVMYSTKCLGIII